MRRSPKLWSGLYGLGFHSAVAAVLVWTGIRNQTGIPARFWWTTVPPFLVASFVVYALLVGPYLPRRPATRGAVLFDSVVGMLAECAVIVVTALLYSLATSMRGQAGGGVSHYLAEVATSSLLAFLWSFGSFFTQILVVGNVAGLVGWVVLKRLSR